MKSAVGPGFVLLLVSLLGACGSPAEQETPDGGVDGVAAVESAPDPLQLGEELYDQYCFSCHNAGLSGAPKLGDVEAWAPRAAKGAELLLQATIEGVPPAMPPRGLCMSCSDEELDVIIDYMLARSQ